MPQLHSLFIELVFCYILRILNVFLGYHMTGCYSIETSDAMVGILLVIIAADSGSRGQSHTATGKKQRLTHLKCLWEIDITFDGWRLPNSLPKLTRQNIMFNDHFLNRLLCKPSVQNRIIGLVLNLRVSLR